ncbi:hypothetical protein DPMN_145866 [Dreissena polymorpha]|uniref:Uncharacterized protein n=1 Tax=Dreissena polymorpha TaxID=45954 RepID=A0A9D4F999_DREPO|nr:hypothetical protein DPMN_145866 [Dreissena polymorpha]
MVCQSWKSMDFCECELTPVKRGCNFTQIFDQTHPKTAEMAEMVSKKCTPFECRQECLALRKEPLFPRRRSRPLPRLDHAEP